MATIKFVTMFSGYDPKSRFCNQKDKVSRTVQDAVVDVLGLFEQFNGQIPLLFDKYNNGLLYESSVGVFVDELNAEEVKKYNEFVDRQKQQEAERLENERLFDEFKQMKAQEVLAKRAVTSVPSGHQEESKS